MDDGKESGLPNGSGVPSLAADPVAVAGPLDAVLAVGTVLVVDVSSAVGPERVVVTVVVTGAARGAATLVYGESGGVDGRVLERSGRDARDDRADSEDGRERDHVDYGCLASEVKVSWMACLEFDLVEQEAYIEPWAAECGASTSRGWSRITQVNAVIGKNIKAGNSFKEWCADESSREQRSGSMGPSFLSSKRSFIEASRLREPFICHKDAAKC
jgi:hypothetical protein